MIPMIAITTNNSTSVKPRRMGKSPTSDQRVSRLFFDTGFKATELISHVFIRNPSVNCVMVAVAFGPDAVSNLSQPQNVDMTSHSIFSAKKTKMGIPIIQLFYSLC